MSGEASLEWTCLEVFAPTRRRAPYVETQYSAFDDILVGASCGIKNLRPSAIIAPGNRFPCSAGCVYRTSANRATDATSNPEPCAILATPLAPERGQAPRVGAPVP